MKFKFDKFVKDLEKREQANQEEKWQNSIKFNWRKK